MKQFSRWKSEEIQKLFKYIEDGKNNNKKLSFLFSSFAKNNNRQPNSVRNYYYNELNYLENNIEQAKLMNIDLSKHKKCEQKPFTKKETEYIINEIDKYKQKGISVRQACYKISNGDLSKMVRIQNKYRTIKNLQEKEKTSKTINTETNIIKMQPRQNSLTDSDINSLFLGLVKLVKKQAEENVSFAIKKECENANDALRKSIIEIEEKQKEIDLLRAKIKVVIRQNEEMEKQIVCLRAKAINLLDKKFKSKKLESLKSFCKRDKDKKVLIN